MRPAPAPARPVAPAAAPGSSATPKASPPIARATSDDGDYANQRIDEFSAAGAFIKALLFPVLKRQNESIALGYVASRVLESTVIVVGLIGLLSVVTLRQKYAGASGADSASLIIAGQSLVALFHNWTFLLGPAFCAGIGNGRLLGYLMYRSGLMPRRLTYLGLIGGPLVVVSAIATLFGAYTQTSS